MFDWYKNVDDKCALLLSIYLCFRDSAFPLPLPGWSHYVIMSVFALILTSRGFRINALMMVFLIWAAFSIIFNNPDPVFQSWPRYCTFLLLVLNAGPLNSSKFAMEFRANVFKYSMFLIVAMSIGSLVAYWTGNPIFYHGYQYFKGLYNHSMSLGPMAAISAVFCFQLWLGDKNGGMKRRIWLLLAVGSALMCMLASSRTAFIAMLFSGGVILLAVYKGRIGQMLAVVVGVVGVVAITSPLWQSFATGLLNKQENQDLMGENSRIALWNDRIAEFQDSPIFGQGFSAMNPNIVSDESFNIITGVIEPGSSWLYVLSALGLVGFTLFCIIVIPQTVKLFFNRNVQPDSMAMTVLGVNLIFLVHMLSEGYILAGGTAICFFAWLSFAVAKPSSLECNDFYTRKWIQ